MYALACEKIQNLFFLEIMITTAVKNILVVSTSRGGILKATDFVKLWFSACYSGCAPDKRLTLRGSLSIRYLPSGSFMQVSMIQRNIPQALSMLRAI